MAEIYLAGGCFGAWKVLLPIEGVKKTTVGYANGQVNQTNY